MSKIKIFISYKDRHPIIKSEILTPIQTGRAIADEIFDEMIGDDTGENISNKNSMYNELSAQYWAWKNYDKIGNPDYIGFMHYRRHFIFNKNDYKLNFLGVAHFKEFNEDYRNEISLYDDNIEEFVGNNDLICIKRLCLKERVKRLNAPQCATPRGCYYFNRGLKAKDYDLMIETLKELKPEYSSSAELYSNGNISFGYNSFIMTKDLFFEYNEFLFTILFALEKKIDFSNYCTQGIRTLGYLGERLLSIFILHKLNEGLLKIKETPMSFIENSAEKKQISLQNLSDNCICITSSNQFAPYTYVAIKSIIDNWDKTNFLDIIILTKDMSDINKKIFEENFSSNNVSIRYCDMNFFDVPKNVKKTNSITETTYYRILVPQILKNYNKVLFLDADIIVKDDLSKLFALDMKGYQLGLTLDSVMQCFCVDNLHKDYEYLTEILELKDPFKYYNCGVMLFNINEISSYDIQNV